MNTVSHLNTAFGARKDAGLLTQESIQTKDGHSIKLNIQHAIMIKTAESSDALRQLITAAQTNELDIAEFTREMLETTDDKKVIQRTLEQNRDDIEYLGVLVYGKKSTVDKLTEDFQLYK